MQKLEVSAKETEVWQYVPARRFLDGDPFLAGHEVCIDGWPCDRGDEEVCQYSHSW